MTTEDRKLPQIVEVVWADAHTEPVSGNTWFDRSEIDDTPYLVRSVGILLENVKAAHTSIAQSEAVSDQLVDSVLHIPNQMVIIVRTLQ